MRWRPRVAKWAFFLVEERADARKEEGVAIFPPLVSNPNLNSDKGSRYDQVLASCEGLVELQPHEIIGDLCRRRTGTVLLGDGPGQSDASGELLLSTRQVSSVVLVVLATHERRRSQEPSES